MMTSFLFSNTTKAKENTKKKYFTNLPDDVIFYIGIYLLQDIKAFVFFSRVDKRTFKIAKTRFSAFDKLMSENQLKYLQNQQERMMKFLKVNDKEECAELDELLQNKDLNEENYYSIYRYMTTLMYSYSIECEKFLSSHHHKDAVRTILKPIDNLWNPEKKNFTEKLNKPAKELLVNMLENLKTALIKNKKPLNPNGDLANRIRFIQTLSKCYVIDLSEFCNTDKFDYLVEKFNDPATQPKEKIPSTKFRIEVHIDVGDGYGLFITGDKLGSWKQCFRLKPESSDVWTIEVDSSLAGSEFKFLVGKWDLGKEALIDPQELTWEKRINHKFNDKDSFTSMDVLYVVNGLSIDLPSSSHHNAFR